MTSCAVQCFPTVPGIVDQIVGIRDHDDGCRLAVVATGIVGATDIENRLIRDRS
jgi:riboflavin synthase